MNVRIEKINEEHQKYHRADRCSKRQDKRREAEKRKR
jgi:hypothetical protein